MFTPFLSFVLIIMVSRYRIFEKAGMPGWKSLIPVYRLILFMDILDRKRWDAVLLFIPIVNIIFTIYCLVILSRKFGKDTLFGILIFFLSFIFYPILAFGKSEYNGNLGGKERHSIDYDKSLIGYFLPIVTLLAIWIFYTCQTGATYLQPWNIYNILYHSSIIGFAALGMVFVLKAGKVDLSAGSLIAFICVITALLNTNVFSSGIGSSILLIIITLCIGALSGLAQGSLISYARLPSALVTLGGLVFFRNLALLITNGRPINAPDFPDFQILSFLQVIGIPFIFLLLVSAVILISFLYQKTYWGKSFFTASKSDTSSPEAKLNTLTIYTAMGILCAFSAILLTGRVKSGMPTAGIQYEIDTIICALIGGALIMGNRKTIWPVIIGIVAYASLNQGMMIMNISSYSLCLFKGVLLITSVLLTRLINNYKTPEAEERVLTA